MHEWPTERLRVLLIFLVANVNIFDSSNSHHWIVRREIKRLVRNGGPNNVQFHSPNFSRVLSNENVDFFQWLNEAEIEGTISLFS